MMMCTVVLPEAVLRVAPTHRQAVLPTAAVHGVQIPMERPVEVEVQILTAVQAVAAPRIPTVARVVAVVLTHIVRANVAAPRLVTKRIAHRAEAQKLTAYPAVAQNHLQAEAVRLTVVVVQAADADNKVLYCLRKKIGV